MTIDVRVMAATNRDLEAEVAAGRFRADLYYRLAVVTLRIPPLRERREDVPPLVSSYLDHFATVFGGSPRGITARALTALTGYSWPGNVRELINIIERSCLVASGEEIDLGDLPAGVTGHAAHLAGDPSGASLVGADGPPDLPAAAAWRGRPLAEARDEVLEQFHRRYLGLLLAENNGRIGDTAKAADVSPRTLYELMRRYGLRKEDYREGGSEAGP
jgi:DNA-binding NtrC family response regulator